MLERAETLALALAKFFYLHLLATAALKTSLQQAAGYRLPRTNEVLEHVELLGAACSCSVALLKVEVARCHHLCLALHLGNPWDATRHSTCIVQVLISKESDQLLLFVRDSSGKKAPGDPRVSKETENVSKKDLRRYTP